MKLNYKRTILVGFAFFLIMAFWQAYDATIPVILTNKFGMSQLWSGVIMAADNILALFMLPLFGALSDKCKNRRGRRTPFIIIGTTIAAVTLVALSFVDNMQLQKISEYTKIDDQQTLVRIYEQQADATLKTPEGDEFVLHDKFTKEEFSQIKMNEKDPVTGKDKVSDAYTNYVAPAREACVADITAQDPSALIIFIAVLLVILVSMSIFRSPAVALMPDVTIKPLRSKANAVINLMGTAGGIAILGLGIVLKTSAAGNVFMNYYLYFAIVAGLMLVALLVFLLTVREPLWAKQMQEDTIRYGIEEKAEHQDSARKLTRSEFISLILILLSVALWYFGYNAVTSKYSVYAGKILDMDYNSTMLLAQASAIVAYLPAGMLASKIGRKKTIIGGVILLAAAFGAASFMRAGSSELVMNVLFVLAGVGWATINVNSFPMVVELSSGSDVGKYTGYYYTASMAAQILTPILSGYLMDLTGDTVLFPYAAIFVALAIVTMLFVTRGDSKVPHKKGIEALVVED
ncbi:MAG: SLC45 family MFS transporter [Ruminococcaceae bacterium]|nr:SLC45 family MFS transporter [Oscillospiraceae bacterium]